MAKKASKKKRKSAKTPKGEGATAMKKRLVGIDEQLVHLLNERAELFGRIAALGGGPGQSPFSPSEDEAVLQRVRRWSEAQGGSLSPNCVRQVFRELLSGCHSLQQRARVAYLGPEFTFSHVAAVERFGHDADLAPVASIAAVFEEVQRGDAEYGIVPMENSTDGRVTDTLDMFAKTPLRLCGEVPLRIHHNLMAHCSRAEVRQVHSKPQALSQCRYWLSRHLPDAELCAVASTAEAAHHALQEKYVAAVASVQAAAHYGLNVLAANIEDDPANLTRFAIIARQSSARSGDDKTSLMFEVEHQPGALADGMAIFKRNRLNMTWIESFPVPRSPGRYLFFVEVEGHESDLRLRRAVASLEKKTLQLKILGSYPRIDPIG